MTSFALWVSMGFCSGYVNGDPEMSEYLCDRQYHASLRMFDRPQIPNYPDLPTRPRPKQGNEIRA